MAKRCKKCGVPLEGFLYDFVAAKLFGIRPSQKDGEMCNKCEREDEKASCSCCQK